MNPVATSNYPTIHSVFARNAERKIPDAELIANTRTDTGFQSSPSASEAIDFRNMTRQEMFDWMNDQIRNGKMSLDESSPFLGMTVKLSATTGQPVDMTTDTERFNFFEKARNGIEFARSRFDYDSAERLQTAIQTMERLQKNLMGVDLIA